MNVCNIIVFMNIGKNFIGQTIARVMFDTMSTLSYIVEHVAKHLVMNVKELATAVWLSTPLGDKMVCNHYFSNTVIKVGGRKIMVDLILLRMNQFDVILGMDWLSHYNATVRCQER